MALKPCRECKKEVSHEAKTCPHCGVENPAGGASKLVIFGAVFIGLVVIGAISSSGDKDEKPSGPSSTESALSAPSAPISPDVRAPSAPPSSPKPSAPAAAPIDVTAVALWKAYDDNEVAADVVYKGKNLAVTGKVAGIDKDILGDVVVRLRSPNEFLDVHATLHESQASAAAALKKGSKVTVICVGEGFMMGSPMLAKCRLR